MKMAFQLKKVLITDKVDPKCVDILKANGIEVEFNTALAKDKSQLIAEIPKYDGLIVRSATKVTSDVIAAAKNLKIIGRAGTGVDNIDCDAATKHGVIVMNTPGGNTMSAAEHTCTLLLAVSRHVAQGTASLRAGRWDRSKLMGNEVYGKTLAIIGLGRIGREVASRMQAFGMTTIGFDPIVSAAEAAESNIEWMPIDDLWARADYVTVHTPLIPQTRNLVGTEVFSKCKPNLRVVNCARGGIIDEKALLDALNNGRCGGAGLDVFVEEPPTNMDLIEHPLVVSTPHLGASTVEAQSRVAEEIAQQFVDMTQGKSLVGAINAQALANAMSPSTLPFVQLGQSLGKLGAASAGPLEANTDITLITQGDSLKSAGGYLTAAVLVGLLKGRSENGLNLVSAPAYAKELGFKSSTEHKGKEGLCSDLDNTVSLVIKTADGNVKSFSGSVVGGCPILLEICGAWFSSGGPWLKGNMVVYKGKATPAVFASVTAALTASNAQILTYMSSTPSNGESWGVLKVAAPVDSLDAVKSNVTAVYQIEC